MTTLEIIGYCMAAFGIGYSCGHVLLIGRRAIESID